MNYQQIDAERIRKNKERRSIGNNSGNEGYSQSALNALAKGQYANLTNRTPQYKTSDEQKKSVPHLEGMKSLDSDRPSTKYHSRNLTQTASTRDTTYDKDFDTFYDWRYEKQDIRDYDAATDTETEHWRNVKSDLMKKNKWSEKEFDEKFDDYYKERRQKENNQEVNRWTKFAEKHPVAASIGQALIFNPQTWIEGGASVVEGLLSHVLPENLKEKYIASEANDPRLQGTRVREAVKQTVRDNIDSGLGKMAYEAGVGLLDLPGGAAGMAANTAASAQRRKLENGVSRDKAAQTAMLSGLTSYITNKIGLEKALGAEAQTATGALGKAMLAEGAENLVEDTVNNISDLAINQQKSDLVNLYNYYTSKGMAPKEAIWQVAKDTGSDEAASFLTGAIMGGTMNAMNNLPSLSAEIGDRIQYNKQPKSQAIQDILNGKIPEVTSEADIQRAQSQQNEAIEKLQDIVEKLPALSDEAEARNARNLDRIPDRVFEEAADRLIRESREPQEITPQDVINQNIIGQLDNNDGMTYNDVTKGGLPYEPIQASNGNDGRGSEGILRGTDENGRVAEELRGIESEGRGQLSTDSIRRAKQLVNNPSVFTPEEIKTLNAGGIEVKNFYNANTDPELFVDALETAKASNPNGAAVDSHDVNQIQDIINNGGNVFLVDDGTTGYAVEGDGNLTAVFKNKSNTTPFMGSKIALASTKNGAVKGDCFGRKLVNIYSAGGFEPVARMKYGYGFNDAMDNQVKNQLASGIISKEPDVYVLKLRDDFDYNRSVADFNKAKVYSQAELDSLPEFTDYEEMLSYRDSLIKQPEEKTPANGFSRMQKLFDEANARRNRVPEYNPDEAVEAQIEALQNAARSRESTNNNVKTQNTNEQKVPSLRDISESLGKITSSDVDYEDAIYNPETGEYEWLENAGLENNTEPDTYTLEEPVKPGEGFIEDGKSRVVTNSAINADIISRFDYDNDPVLQKIATYAKHNNETTYNNALENVKNNGAKLLEEYNNGTRNIDNDQDVDQAMILLQNLSDQMRSGEKDVVSQRNLLLSRLREAGTKWGQSVQAFAKWNDTADGLLINGERINQERVNNWKTTNKKATTINNKIAKALANMGVDSSMRNKTSEPKTHDEIKEGVRKVLEREFGSVEQHFNDNDLEFLTILAEDKRIPVWQITDEIEHKLNFGDWYSLDESIEPERPINQKLKNALDDLIEREPAPEKAPLTPEEITEQVRNTLDREAASLGEEFTDDDVNYLSNLIQNNATRQELAEALNTKLATGRFGISEDTQNKVNLLFEEANHYDPNSKEAFEARSAAYKLIADEVVGDASPLEKFDAWRYLAMLGNPKTMVRNWVGNKLFGAVTGVSNNLSAALEAGTDKISKALGGEGIQRTKTFLNPAKDRALIKASADDGEAHRYTELNGTKYEKGPKDAIKQQKSVFNNKLIQLYEKATDRGISDYNAVKKKYSTSLAGYLKANGFDESIFDADNTYRGLKEISRHRVLTDAERAQMDKLEDYSKQLDKARDYAVKQAEYATFHEDNAVAKLLTDFSRKARNSDSPVARTIGYMAEGLVPFKKTPANILRSGVEYSPLGLAKSLVDTARFGYENTGSRKGNLEDTYTKKGKFTGREKEVTKLTAAEVLDSWSKTLTGSALVALGYYLKNNGVLNSSNKDEKYQDDLEGIQNYSLKIGDKTYTLDWAAPAVMPLLVGAEISKIKDRNGLLDKNIYENMDEIIGTANALLDPIFETSMMQGVKNSLEAAANEVKYNDEGAMGGIAGAIATNTLTGYLTQGLPTLSGQIARTIDNTRRSTDTKAEGNFLGGVEKQGRKLANKIPGLSFLNEEYRDAYGRTQKNGDFDNPLANLAYQMASPAYIRDINTTEADKSARKVYYAKGKPDENGKELPIMDKDVFASWKSKVTENGKKYTPEEMNIYRKESGEANYNIRTALAKEDWFNNLDGDRQTDILKKVNTLVDKIGKEAAGHPQDNDDLEAYKKGIPSLLERYQDKEIGKYVTEQTGLSSNTNMAKEIKETIKGGDQKAIQQKLEEGKQYAKDKEKADALNMKVDTYLKKEKEYEGGAEQYAKDRKTAEELNMKPESYNKLIEDAGDNADKVLKAVPELKRNGLANTNAYHVYANAIKEVPSLTTAEFVRTFNQIDTDNSKGIKQAELLDYIERTGADEKTANEIWNTYGGYTNKAGEKKKIKKNKKGKWTSYY